MGLPAYIANNLCRTSDTDTFDGAPLQDATNYPASNIGNGILGKGSRLTYLGGYYEVHFTNSPWIDYNSVFIGNHSLTSTGTIEILGGTSSPAATSLATPAWREKNLWAAIGTQTSRTYIRVTLTQSDGTSIPIELGELVIGPRVALPRGVDWIMPKSEEEVGVRQISRGGAVVGEYIFGRFNTLQPQFQFPESDYAAFRTWHRNTVGSPFVYIPDVDTSEAYYVRMPFEFNAQCIGGGQYSGTFQRVYQWAPLLRMESEGLAVSA